MPDVNRDPTVFTDEEIAALCFECGARCCSCIPYTHGAVDIKAFVKSGDVSMFIESQEEHDRLLEEFRFINENWRQISIVEAKQTATYDIPGWSTEDGASHYYNCRQFDHTTLRCKVYERRPPNCRGFPFFGCSDPQESSDYLGCLIVKEAKRRQRNIERRELRQRDQALAKARKAKPQRRKATGE